MSVETSTVLTDREQDIVLQLVRYLRNSGWLASSSANKPVDGKERPIPWYTYPAIAFLAGRIKPEFSVFEFGSGNSTFWWASRVDRVYAVEHHVRWADYMRDKLPANVTYNYEVLEADGKYSRAAASAGVDFDIIVIDGRDRVNCVKRSIDSLTSSGIFVWDNSNRSRYEEGFEFLRGRSFRRLDFHGLGPINIKPWTTSIFYRGANCLGI